MTEPTFYILDQDSSCRDSLCELGASMGLYVRAYSNSEQFLLGIQPTGPGCVVMEYRLQDRDACDVQDEMFQRAISLPVIILTAHGDVPAVVACMKRGAVEFLEKPFPPARLRAIVQRVIDQHVDQWNREVSQRRALALWEELNTEEREVAQHLALGETNSQIAKLLDVSLRTIQFRRARLMAKMQVTERADLVALIFKAAQIHHSVTSLPESYRSLYKDRIPGFLRIEFDGLRP